MFCSSRRRHCRRIFAGTAGQVQNRYRRRRHCILKVPGYCRRATGHLDVHLVFQGSSALPVSFVGTAGCSGVIKPRAAKEGRQRYSARRHCRPAAGTAGLSGKTASLRVGERGLFKTYLLPHQPRSESSIIAHLLLIQDEASSTSISLPSPPIASRF